MLDFTFERHLLHSKHECVKLFKCVLNFSSRHHPTKYKPMCRPCLLVFFSSKLVFCPICRLKLWYVFIDSVNLTHATITWFFVSLASHLWFDAERNNFWLSHHTSCLLSQAVVHGLEARTLPDPYVMLSSLFCHCSLWYFSHHPFNSLLVSVALHYTNHLLRLFVARLLRPWNHLRRKTPRSPVQLQQISRSSTSWWVFFLYNFCYSQAKLFCEWYCRVL